jgi:DNA uptake protein ComE-like DNA-binding protein
MRRSLISLGFFFSIMLFVSAPALAASSTATEQKAPVGTAVVRTKPAPLIDINSASTATLQTLPGISKAQAERIVAGRPYGSKAWLVSEKRLDDATYQGIKLRVVAKQPFKDGAKNAALYKDRKPPSEAK